MESADGGESSHQYPIAIDTLVNCEMMAFDLSGVKATPKDGTLLGGSQPDYGNEPNLLRPPRLGEQFGSWMRSVGWW
jgi:hypothetical protein